MRNAAWILGLLGLAACGGKVVADGPAGDGGSGGTSSTTTTSSGTSTSSTGTTTTTSVSTGPGPCTSSEDCGPGQVCVFATGTCAKRCEAFSCDPCGPGFTCEPCATSSCPGCEDCVPACQPTKPGQCDDDDPCPPGNDLACDFANRQCLLRCDDPSGCADDAFCSECQSGSCCGCDDCVALCTPV